MGHVIEKKKGGNNISMCVGSYGKPQEWDWLQVGKSLWFSRDGYSSCPRALGSKIPSSGDVTFTLGVLPCLRRDNSPHPMDVLGFWPDLVAHPILG